jgi:hypothetical protein
MNLGYRKEVDGQRRWPRRLDSRHSRGRHRRGRDTGGRLTIVFSLHGLHHPLPVPSRAEPKERRSGRGLGYPMHLFSSTRAVWLVVPCRGDARVLPGSTPGGSEPQLPRPHPSATVLNREAARSTSSRRECLRTRCPVASVPLMAAWPSLCLLPRSVRWRPAKLAAYLPAVCPWS